MFEEIANLLRAVGWVALMGVVFSLFMNMLRDFNADSGYSRSSGGGTARFWYEDKHGEGSWDRERRRNAITLEIIRWLLAGGASVALVVMTFIAVKPEAALPVLPLAAVLIAVTWFISRLDTGWRSLVGFIAVGLIAAIFVSRVILGYKGP